MKDPIHEDDIHCLNRASGILLRFRDKLGDRSKLSLTVSRSGVEIEAKAFRYIPRSEPHRYTDDDVIRIVSTHRSLEDAIEADLLSSIVKVVSAVQEIQSRPHHCATCEASTKAQKCPL
jgi:hypothetical protein